MFFVFIFFFNFMFQYSKSSSIICNTISSTNPSSLPPSGTAAAAPPSLCSWSWFFFFPSSTLVMTQLESDSDPARLCHNPMCELWVSSRRQVTEGDGRLQHFRSFAFRIDEREEGGGSWLVWSWSETGKFVLAFLPLISTAASSYALAASSAESKVPSHTLLFL